MTDFDLRTITPPIRAKLIELCSAALTYNAGTQHSSKPHFFVAFSENFAYVSAWINNECVYNSDNIYLHASSLQTEEEILRNIAAALDDIDKLQKTWEGFAQGGAHA